MHFAGPVPDEGGCFTELEGKRRVDGIWIDPKLLIARRKEEMEYMRKMEVFEVVDEKVFSPMPPTMMTGHDEARRWIYTYLLEGHEQEGNVSRLCRSMYGTRDAASIWGDTWSEVLKDGSMNVGTACPAFFCKSRRKSQRIVSW